MAQQDGVIDVSHVCKLTCAARKQYFAEHDARAVELYERAVTAAEALRQPDCLIVASLRSFRLEAQYNKTVSSLSGDVSADSRRRVAVEVLAVMTARLPGVFETLERRRAAGTLLSDRCRAHELAWEEEMVRTSPRLSGETELDEASILQAAQLIGVAAYFATARNAVLASQACQALGFGPDEPLLGRCLHEHALLLTLHEEQPDLGEPFVVRVPSFELLFLSIFRTRLLPYLDPTEPHCARLLAAWRAVEQSGLLQKLPIEQTCERQARLSKSLADAQAAKDAGVPLRVCALPFCGAREAHVAHFKKCSACSQVVYCSKQHQTEHWLAHKAACKAARKAAATDKQDGNATASSGGASQS